MAHYIAIIVPSGDGALRVVFPDLPGCEACGATMDEARLAAVDALSRCLEENGEQLPPPSDLTMIERDQAWLSSHGVDLSKAIVTMVSVIA